MRSKIKYLALFLPILAIVAWRTRSWPAGTTANNARWLGRKNIELLTGATRTEAYRIHPTDFKRGNRFDSVTLGAPKIMNAAFTKRLAATVLDNFDSPDPNLPLCLPRPAVALRMWNGAQSIDVLLCFECREIDLRINQAGKPQNPSEQLSFGMKDGGEELLKVAKEAFPNDLELQAVKIKPGD